MSKVWVILKREYAQVVKKKSFVVMVFLMPVLMGALMILPAMLARRDVSSPQRLAIIDSGELHLGQKFAESLSRYTLEDSEVPAYRIADLFVIPSEDNERHRHIYDSLAQEISEQQLKYLVVIGPDAHKSDSGLQLVTNASHFRTLRRFEYQLSRLISSHRLRDSEINLPVDSVLVLTRNIDMVVRDALGHTIPGGVREGAAIVFVLITYMMIILWGSALMRSIIEEKTNRIIEVVVSSASPFQLLLGKILGMGAAAFTQVGVWVAAGAVMMLMSNTSGLEINDAISRIVFNPVVAVFFALFLVSGFLLYSTMFAIVGSSVNSDKEAQNFIMPIILPLIFSLPLGMGIVNDPDATWVLALAYIPVFTPTLMMFRVVFIAPTTSGYSLFSGILGEATLAFLIIAAATIGLTWIAAKIFRVGILMYGKRPTLPEIIKWVRT